MKRLIIRLGTWLVLGLAAALFVTWHVAFRPPIRHLLPLPPELIALGAPDGQRLLSESRYIADFEALSRSFVPQARREYAGVATAVAVLNAIHQPAVPLTQSSFFGAGVRRVGGSVRISLGGMCFLRLRAALRERGTDADARYASASEKHAFREQLRENLARSGDYLVVWYSRAALRQQGRDNIAPLAAYHATTDRVLVLDPAAANYPPVWVPVDSLWNAMRASDGGEPGGRGFVTVRERSH